MCVASSKFSQHSLFQDNDQSLMDNVDKLWLTFNYEMYAFKYLHICPTLLAKFTSTRFKNLQCSFCLGFVPFSMLELKHLSEYLAFHEVA